MPLRLTANETNLSGNNYNDVLGVRYEFPRRYRNLVRVGEPFVYYRGRRRADGGTRPHAYLGTGIIGTIRESASNPDFLVSEIEDWHAFPEPLYFKDSTGAYYEQVGDQGGYYWQPGVRRISEQTLERIVRDAGQSISPRERIDRDRVLVATQYASRAVLDAVDAYAMKAAEAEVRRLWPGCTVERQPHNNPGFDISIGPADDRHRYIEVKGTTLDRPRFFLSEGERDFAEKHGGCYTLLVIYCIDLSSQSHRIFRWDGPITTQVFAMNTRQWVCEVRTERGP